MKDFGSLVILLGQENGPPSACSEEMREMIRVLVAHCWSMARILIEVVLYTAVLLRFVEEKK